jgi:hypothetical protein
MIAKNLREDGYPFTQYWCEAFEKLLAGRDKFTSEVTSDLKSEQHGRMTGIALKL